MAEKLWIEVLNMSLTGSVIIGAVLVFRLLLRRAPRIFLMLFGRQCCSACCVPFLSPLPFPFWEFCRTIRQAREK